MKGLEMLADGGAQGRSSWKLEVGAHQDARWLNPSGGMPAERPEARGRISPSAA